MKKRHSSPTIPPAVIGPVRRLVKAYLRWQVLEESGAPDRACNRAEDDFREIAGELCGWSDFDQALDDAREAIAGISGINQVAFMSTLLSEATGTLLSDVNDRPVQADLFFVPVNGLIEGIERFVDVNASPLAKAFRDTGLAAEKSNVVVTPILIDQIEALNMMPGQLRSALETLIPSMSGRDKGRVDLTALKAQLGLAARAPSAKGNPVSGDRLILCARLGMVDTEAEVAFDDLTSGLIDAIEEAPAAEEWLERVVDMTGDEVHVSLPCSLPRGVAVMALNRVQSALSFEAIRIGLDPMEGFDEIHFGRSGDSALFEATLSGHRLGPIDVPILSVVLDSDWFTDELDQMARAVMSYEDAALMPQAAAIRN